MAIHGHVQTVRVNIIHAAVVTMKKNLSKNVVHMLQSQFLFLFFSLSFSFCILETNFSSENTKNGHRKIYVSHQEKQ